AVSHTFILNEVLRLRALGLPIAVASINDTDRAPDALTADERQEAAATFYVKRQGAGGALAAHLATLLTHPLRWLAGLRTAPSLGGSDGRRLLLGLAYFSEALIVGRWMARQGRRAPRVPFPHPRAPAG